MRSFKQKYGAMTIAINGCKKLFEYADEVNDKHGSDQAKLVPILRIDSSDKYTNEVEIVVGAMINDIVIIKLKIDSFMLTQSRRPASIVDWYINKVIVAINNYIDEDPETALEDLHVFNPLYQPPQAELNAEQIDRDEATNRYLDIIEQRMALENERLQVEQQRLEYAEKLKEIEREKLEQAQNQQWPSYIG